MALKPNFSSNSDKEKLHFASLANTADLDFKNWSDDALRTPSNYFVYFVLQVTVLLLLTFCSVSRLRQRDDR